VLSAQAGYERSVFPLGRDDEIGAIQDGPIQPPGTEARRVDTSVAQDALHGGSHRVVDESSCARGLDTNPFDAGTDHT
jgi:hypothetical protein